MLSHLRFARLLSFISIFGISNAIKPELMYGILTVSINDLDVRNFCVIYFPELSEFSPSPNNASRYPISNLLDISKSNSCDPKDPSMSGALINGRIPFVSSVNGTYNCSIGKRAELAQSVGAEGLLSDGTVSLKFDPSKNKINISVASLARSSQRKELLGLAKDYPNSELFFYQVRESYFDPSAVVIVILAVFAVVVGSFWSGHTQEAIRLKKKQRTPITEDGEEYEHRETFTSRLFDVDEEVSSWNQRPLTIFLILCFVCGLLLLLYFFFFVMVYIFIVFFVLGSSMSTYVTLEPIIIWSYSACPKCPTLELSKILPKRVGCNIELRQLLLLVGSFISPIIWFVYRNSNWSWTLQDILGIIFSITILRMLRAHSLKICTYLLCCLFVYDIFFVFITPYFTKNGESIMVEVARSSDKVERLPLVLIVPRLGNTIMRICNSRNAILGFGDIIVPGILVSFCHAYDLYKKRPLKLYWITTSIAYFFGMIMTIIGSLYIVPGAQPALLYLVPFTLIPTVGIAYFKGELKEMWGGYYREDNLPESLENN